MATVKEQLAAKKAAAAAENTEAPAAKTRTRRAAKPAAAKTGTAKAATKSAPEAETKPARTKLTPEQKEERKQQAFAKLKADAVVKRQAKREELTARTAETKKGLKKNAVKYLTRASYFGCKVKVQKVEEVRGRILVSVLLVTKKDGNEPWPVDGDTRRVAPEFLVDEFPGKRDKPLTKKQRERAEARAAKAEAKKAGRKRAKKADPDEIEADDESEDLEDELEDEEELEEDEDTEDAEDEDEEEDDTEEADDEADEDEDEEEDDEDSWDE